MLFSPPVHVALIAFALVAIPLAGWALRARRGGAAILLWLIPVALVASVADLGLHALESVRAGSAYRAAPGGGRRMVFAALVLLPPVEIFYQRLVTRIAGGGLHTAARLEPLPVAPSSEQADPEDSGG